MAALTKKQKLLIADMLEADADWNHAKNMHKSMCNFRNRHLKLDETKLNQTLKDLYDLSEGYRKLRDELATELGMENK